MGMCRAGFIILCVVVTNQYHPRLIVEYICAIFESFYLLISYCFDDYGATANRHFCSMSLVPTPIPTPLPVTRTLRRLNTIEVPQRRYKQQQ